MREFKVDGTRFAINGRPLFLRGTLECAIFPLTGYPPTDTDYWKKIYTAVKNHGLNHVRFHSWCPPKTAFVAADEMGIYLQVEFTSIFWNTAWTGGQKPHTLGILCNPDHPALELFPTEYHSNWQWWDAMSHSDAVQLDLFSADLRPIVRIIDDWVSNRRLALLFEAKVGEGSILVSGVNLINDLETRPEARQLLKSLKNYMHGEKFNPSVQLKMNEVQAIFAE